MHDMANSYYFFLKRKTKKNRKLNDIIFNLGFENLSIINMAEKIKKTLNLKSKILINLVTIQGLTDKTPIEF